MKTFRFFLLLLLIMSLSSCAVSKWKESLVVIGSVNDVISNVITDFSHTSKLYKQDSIFEVLTTDVSEDIVVVGIIGAVDVVYPRPEHKVGAYDDVFPTKYLLKDNKLFYWSDSTQAITQDIINILAKYNHIDTEWQEEWEIPPYVIDDGKEGVVYYICKNNYKNYKKTGSNTISKRYKQPVLRCSKQ